MRDAGCGMRDAECGMWRMRNVEGGIRDENILAVSGWAHFNWWPGKRDSFEIDSGMRDFNSKWRFGIEEKILKLEGWRDEAKTSGGMRDFKSLFWGLLEHTFYTLHWPSFSRNQTNVHKMYLKDKWTATQNGNQISVTFTFNWFDTIRLFSLVARPNWGWYSFSSFNVFRLHSKLFTGNIPE